MKFDLLLARYLYQNKRLNLPGIGTFEADPSVTASAENEKQKPSMDGISFRNVSVTKADDDLIEFIKDHTGKMKPLAISDLESYLALGKQFLFIGKPFYLEGIGTLKLTQEGRFEFTPGEYVTTKLDDPNVERSEGKKRSVHEENRIEQESTNNNIKKVLLGVFVLGGIALLVWGSSNLYTRYADRQNQSMMVDSTGTLQRVNTEQAPAAVPVSKDSMQTQAAVAAPSTSGMYNFVVETTDNKLRAVNRYGVLKSYGNKIQLTTTDSVQYKLFYTLHADPSDTARIRDSLNRWYYGNTKTIRVRVEQ